MSSYPVSPDAAPVWAGMVVAVPAKLLASPLRNGRDLGEADRSSLVVGGTERIRAGGSRFRNTCDRDRHRPRKSKSPSTFPHAGLKDTITRIAPAVITLANTPA